MTLTELKEDIKTDILNQIRERTVIGDEILPLNPVKVQVVGKSAASLQVRVMYRDCAPFYFKVGQL